MSTKVITDPSALGWEQDGETPNGTPLYQWSGGQDMGPIKDGDTEGQITTWDGAEWTPDSSLTIDASGDATFTGDLRTSGRYIVSGAGVIGPIVENGTPLGLDLLNNGSRGITLSTSDSARLTIDSTGNVGIGDVSPSRKLTAIASQSVVGRFESTGSIGGMIGFADATTSPPTNSSGDPIDMRIGSIGDEFHVFTGNASRLTIDATGQSKFSGMARFGNPFGANNGVKINPLGAVYVHRTGSLGSEDVFQGNGAGIITSRIRGNGDATFSGTVTSASTRSNLFIQDGSPVIDAKGLIKTLSTLRQATMDETQDIRESLRSAIDELVEGFEQEIASMPAPEES